MRCIARDLERVCDRATNDAEIVGYLIGGIVVEQERAKADATKSIILPAAS